MRSALGLASGCASFVLDVFVVVVVSCRVFSLSCSVFSFSLESFYMNSVVWALFIALRLLKDKFINGQQLSLDCDHWNISLLHKGRKLVAIETRIAHVHKAKRHSALPQPLDHLLRVGVQRLRERAVDKGNALSVARSLHGLVLCVALVAAQDALVQLRGLSDHGGDGRGIGRGETAGLAAARQHNGRRQGVDAKETRGVAGILDGDAQREKRGSGGRGGRGGSTLVRKSEGSSEAAWKISRERADSSRVAFRAAKPHPRRLP